MAAYLCFWEFSSQETFYFYFSLRHILEHCHGWIQPKMCIKEQGSGIMKPGQLVPDHPVLGNSQQSTGAALKDLWRSYNWLIFFKCSICLGHAWEAWKIGWGKIFLLCSWPQDRRHFCLLSGFCTCVLVCLLVGFVFCFFWKLVLGMEPQTSCILKKHSIIELHPQPFSFISF